MLTGLSNTKTGNQNRVRGLLGRAAKPLVLLTFALILSGLASLAYQQLDTSPARVAYAFNPPVVTVPYKVNFQARLTDQNGNIMPDGSYNVKFRLFTNSAGTGSPVWEEDYLVANSQGVSLANGLFSVQLGSITALTPQLFSSNPNLWLQIELPSPSTATSSSPSWTEGPMSPLQPLESAPYAMNADTLDGIDSTQLARIDQGNTFTGNNTFSNNVTIVGASTLQGNATIGSTTSAGVLSFLDGTTDGFNGKLQVATLTGNQIYTLPNATGTICVSSGNCVGGGGAGSGIGGSGTVNTVAMFTAAGTIGNSILTQTGTSGLTDSGTLTVQGTGSSSISGSLGIGTATPGANLDVQSAATTGNALNVTANSLTSGSALNISTQAGGNTSGAIAAIAQTGTITTNSSVANSVLNTQRNVTVNNSGSSNVTLDSTAPANNVTSWSHTTANYPNRVLIVAVTNSPSAVTYNGTPLTLIASSGGLEMWELINPAVGTYTISTGSTYVYGTSSTWYNVNQSSSIAATGSSSAIPPSTTLSPTTTSEMAIDIMSATGWSSVSPGAGQTMFYNPGFGTWMSYKQGTASSTTMSWTGPNNSPQQLAIALKAAGPGISISNSLANFASNCTVVSGSCTDSSNILNLNQQYSGATGTVLNLQNAGSGDFLDIANGSGTLLGGFNNAGQLFYKSGSYTVTLATATQANSVTISIPADTNTTDTFCLHTLNNCASSPGVQTIGALDGGAANTNGAYISGSTLYLQSASASYAGLVNTGTQTFVGNKTFQTTTNSTTAFQVQNASSSSLLTVDTTDGYVAVTAPNSNPGTSPGVARLVVHSNWTDTAGDNSIIDFGENAENQTNAGRLMYNGQTNVTSFGSLNTSGVYNPVLSFNSSNATMLQNWGSTFTIQNNSTTAGIVIKPGSGADSASAVQIQNAAGTSMLNVNTTTGAVTIAGTLDTTTATALNIGTTTANAINIGSATVATTVQGNLTANASLLINGTYTTANNYREYITGTLASSTTTNQYGLQNQVNFSPTGASLTNIFGTVSTPVVSGSSLNISSLYAFTGSTQTTSGYTGTIQTGAIYNAQDASIGGSKLFNNFAEFQGGAISANSGNTSGIINNYGMLLNGSTAGAGTGGTLNNYGLYLTQPAGSGGTTNNYGLYIQGNGAGSTNYSIYNNSTALSYYAGSINSAGGYRYNGTAGATTTCSGGQFLQNQVVQGGITTGGTCASAAAGLTGSGTSGTIAMFSGSSTNLANSILTQSGTTISVGGSLTATGTITTSATGGNALAVTGAPTNSATSSLIQIGSAIQGGNSATNGGTYLGLNAPSSGAGSMADLMNLQVGGSTMFSVDHLGEINGSQISLGGNCMTISSTGIQAPYCASWNITTNGSTFNNAYFGILGSNVHAFDVQNASSTPIFNVDSSTTTITLGDSTSGNYVIFTPSGGLVAHGTAQHAKTILLAPEYAGAVLDAQNDATCTSAANGTMTSGFSTGISGIGNTTQSYYTWTSTQTSAQCYDVVVQVPIPSDFSGWSSSTPLTINTYSSNTSNATMALQAIDSAGTTESNCNYVNITPGTASTWTASGSGCTLAGTYTAGKYMTLRIRMSSLGSANAEIGNIKLTYQSSF